jgi:hypothetical protein
MPRARAASAIAIRLRRPIEQVDAMPEERKLFLRHRDVEQVGQAPSGSQLKDLGELDHVSASNSLRDRVVVLAERRDVAHHGLVTLNASRATP